LKRKKWMEEIRVENKITTINELKDIRTILNIRDN